MKQRHFLVTYTICHGEYEFSGQTVLSLNLGERIRNVVDYYFLHFYESTDRRTKNDKASGYYFYNGGEVLVKKIHYKQITDEQRQVLQDLNVA
jgi:hypothetical protein